MLALLILSSPQIGQGVCAWRLRGMHGMPF